MILQTWRPSSNRKNSGGKHGDGIYTIDERTYSQESLSRVKDMWGKHLQNAIFVVIFCEWLRSGNLATLGHVATELGGE